MFIDIERMDSTSHLMSRTAREELVEAANHLAYNYLRHSGAYLSLTNNEWDALAEKMAGRLLATMDQMVVEASGKSDDNQD